jgi:hypothetical protein
MPSESVQGGVKRPAMPFQSDVDSAIDHVVLLALQHDSPIEFMEAVSSELAYEISRSRAALSPEGVKRGE